MQNWPEMVIHGIKNVGLLQHHSRSSRFHTPGPPKQSELHFSGVVSEERKIQHLTRLHLENVISALEQLTKIIHIYALCPFNQ